jgi:hypothetical protein
MKSGLHFMQNCLSFCIMKKRKKWATPNYLEDLLAARSSNYLASIREAREDYRQGRILSHEQVFTFPKKIEAEDVEFVRACRKRLAKLLKKGERYRALRFSRRP